MKHRQLKIPISSPVISQSIQTIRDFEVLFFGPLGIYTLTCDGAWSVTLFWTESCVAISFWNCFKMCCTKPKWFDAHKQGHILKSGHYNWLWITMTEKWIMDSEHIKWAIIKTICYYTLMPKFQNTILIVYFPIWSTHKHYA